MGKRGLLPRDLLSLPAVRRLLPLALSSLALAACGSSHSSTAASSSAAPPSSSASGPGHDRRAGRVERGPVRPCRRPPRAQSPHLVRPAPHARPAQDLHGDRGDQLRHLRLHARRQGLAQDLGLVLLPGQAPLLRRHHVSPRGRRLRHPGRRSDRDRRRRSRLHGRRSRRRRTPSTCSATWPWPRPQTDPSGASGSQFFIVTAPNATQSAGLTPDYALVGKVVSGMAVVQRIGALPTTPAGDGTPNHAGGHVARDRRGVVAARAFRSRPESVQKAPGAASSIRPCAETPVYRGSLGRILHVWTGENGQPEESAKALCPGCRLKDVATAPTVRERSLLVLQDRLKSIVDLEGPVAAGPSFFCRGLLIGPARKKALALSKFFGHALRNPAEPPIQRAAWVSQPPRKAHRDISGRSTVIVVDLVLIAAAAATGVAHAELAHWRLGQLVVIVVLTIAGDLLSVEAGTKIRVSGTALGVMLALDAARSRRPRWSSACSRVLVGWLRSREQPDQLLNNVANFAWFPLLGGFFFHAAAHMSHVRHERRWASTSWSSQRSSWHSF